MIKKKNKKKIAILGTSPIMILIFFRLIKKYEINVYENSSIGGAWRIEQIKNENYTTHNNVIVPLNKNEEKQIYEINQELKEFNTKKYKPRGLYKISSNYKPKNVFMHDLSNLYNKFKKYSKNLKKIKVEKVEIDNKNIYLNNKKYDLVFFPSCFNIKKIRTNNKNFWVKPKRSISNHLTVMYKNFKFPEIDYSENFDNIFDRGYFKKNKKNIIFTGRIRKKYKLLKNMELIKRSKILSKLSNYILDIKLNKYHHFIINQQKIDRLMFHVNNAKFHLIDTKQFTKSYELMRKLIKSYE